MEDRIREFITVNGVAADRAVVLNVPTTVDVYYIDGIPTIIDSVRGKIAHCRVVVPDESGKFIIKNCFVVRYEDKFAHGDNLKQAFLDAQHKSFDSYSIEERIHEFVDKFPTLETSVDNKELFKWHNRLTGSCEFGRKLLVEKLGLTEGYSTVRDFIKISKGNFGDAIIRKLEDFYQKLSLKENIAS